MKNFLFASILALSSGAALAAEPAQCDSKPFTLGKPAAKPAATTEANAAAAKPAPKPVAQAAPKVKPRLLATCKDGAKKKG